MEPWIVQYLWLIPVLPFAAAALTALLGRRQRGLGAGLPILSMAIALVLSCFALAHSLSSHAEEGVLRETVSFTWMALGDDAVRLGWVLDPLSASMMCMVTFVGLVIFIFSVGYMADDPNFTRFFCFLALFAGAMLTVVIANSLLLLFIGWELVGLASYLLIGFWYDKPSAAAAAKKAFLTTRIGDLGFLLGMVWLYAEAGTLLFYDGGQGCLEGAATTALGATLMSGGMALATGISLLIFCGAVGKSGQVPLHVWLPDAMEGPTPVSALIHAATMVAAGVFLVARVYPLMNAVPEGAALSVVTWVGAITAFFAALIAVAQNDIKRILAYSTVSQLGYMMMGLGVGGVAIGMFHLLTHAFFKALLFLGAGSVIHGCHHEQDIRRMGGLRHLMPITFITYAVGMLALAGVPLFSGFWSKDEILHAAHGWPVSHGPFYLGLMGAFLTAFYMTRQVCYVFLGTYRGSAEGHSKPHESPGVMVVPLVVLALFAGLFGMLGTPFGPWLQEYLGDHHATGVGWGVIGLMLVSILIVAAGLWTGWRLYGKSALSAGDPDVLERLVPRLFGVLREKFYVDELYETTVIRWNRQFARACDWLDEVVISGVVTAVSYAVVGLSWLNKLFDEYVVNGGFDRGCDQVRSGGGFLSKVHTGRGQDYLRWLALAFVILLLLLTWGCTT